MQFYVFSETGTLTLGPGVKFNQLPEQPIFTMHYHIPDNWLIEPVKSIYDLDNIKLSNVEGSLGKKNIEKIDCKKFLFLSLFSSALRI